MMGDFTRTLILIAVSMTIAEGRILRLNSSDDELISDGIDGGEMPCSHQYGFLPCAENAGGYVFNIVVYQVLLILGDKLIDSGSEVLFLVTGPRIGGILFRILRALPSMIFMILSGIFSSKVDAQSQVSVVVGVYAGTIVFSLTVQWFIYMVKFLTASKKHKEATKSNYFSKLMENFKILRENDVKVDIETCLTARIMVLSLIPYLVLQLVYVFRTWSGKRVMTFISLIVSSLSVISYFIYQIYNPWMFRRSLESLDYSNIAYVRKRFLKLLKQFGELLKDQPITEEVIRKFFDEADLDKDKVITFEELQNLVSQNSDGVSDLTNEEMETVLIEFDISNDYSTDKKEFIKGIKKWIQDEQNSASISVSNTKEKSTEQENKVEKFRDIDKIISKILKQTEGLAIRSESLITLDRKPNRDRLERLFQEFDSQKNGTLSEIELKELVCRVKFGRYNMKDEDVIKEMLKTYSKDGKYEKLDKQLFIKGMEEYLQKAVKCFPRMRRNRIIEEYDKIVWKKVYGIRARFIAVLEVILGIAMLTFLAKPLMSNILQLSHAMNFPSYIISFVAVPLAMNAKYLIAAFFPARQERDSSASLILSEIYGGVIMINITGLTTLLAIVYAKELAWDFSAEVLTILVACGVIGLQASFTKTYRLRTCMPALLLYPVSLGLFYFVQAFLNWN